MRQVKRMMFSLLLMVAVMGAWGQGMEEKKMRWLLSKELIPVNISEQFKSEMITELQAEFGTLGVYKTKDLLDADDEQFYFVQNIKESPINGDDYITLANVSVHGYHKVEVKYTGDDGGSKKGAFKNDGWISLQVKGGNRACWLDSEREYRTLTVDSGNRYDHYAYYLDKTISINNLLYSNIFLTIPGFTFSNIEGRNHWSDWPAWWKDPWSSVKVSGKQMYRAKEPEVNILYKRYSDSMGSINFNTNRKVKLITARLYDSKGNLLFNKVVKLEDDLAIKKMDIFNYELLNDGKQKLGELGEGEYSLVVGLIDMFNKIYIYEPETITVDSTPPVVTNPVSKLRSAPSTAFSPADNLFLKWDNISDNFTQRANESDFIYIKVGADNPVKITDYPIGADKAFTVRDKTITINKVDVNLPVENYTNVDIFVVDDVGNQNYLVTGADFSYSSTKPKVALNQQNKIYRNGESVYFDVRDNNEKLRFSKVRIYPKTYSVMYSKIIPVGMPAVLSASRFNNLKASLTADEKVSLDSWYILSPETGFYEINPAINDSDEASLRELLTNNGVIEFGPIKDFSVPLRTLDEGEYNLFIELVDPAYNSNDITNREFTVNVTSSTDDIRISLKDISGINSQVLPSDRVFDFNPVDRLVIEKIEPAVTSYDLSVTSLGLDTGVTGITVNKTGLTAVEHVETISLTPTLDSELLEIVVTAHYGVAKTVQYKRRVTIYNDSFAPQVSSVDNGDGSFTLTVTDESAIKHVAVKEVGLDGYGDPLPLAAPAYSNGSWQLAGWSEQNGDLKSNSFTLYPAPGMGYYIFAVDRWRQHNGGSMQTVKGSSGPVNMTINSQTDLAAYNYNLQGVVVINCNLDITSTETLTFSAIAGIPTTVYMKAGTKITNSGGVINIDAANAPISFRGIGESRKGYNWFGIVNSSGALNITATNRISFSSAEAALTVSVPGTTGNFMTNATLSGLDFTNCLIGIHWLDNGATYKKLTVNSSTFTNCVYGVKLDLIAGSYATANAIDYLMIDDTTCSFNNMSRAKFYWNGVDF